MFLTHTILTPAKSLIMSLQNDKRVTAHSPSRSYRHFACGWKPRDVRSPSLTCVCSRLPPTHIIIQVCISLPFSFLTPLLSLLSLLSPTKTCKTPTMCCTWKQTESLSSEHIDEGPSSILSYTKDLITTIIPSGLQPSW